MCFRSEVGCASRASCGKIFNPCDPCSSSNHCCAVGPRDFTSNAKSKWSCRSDQERKNIKGICGQNRFVSPSALCGTLGGSLSCSPNRNHDDDEIPRQQRFVSPPFIPYVPPDLSAVEETRRLRDQVRKIELEKQSLQDQLREGKKEEEVEESRKQFLATNLAVGILRTTSECPVELEPFDSPTFEGFLLVSLSCGHVLGFTETNTQLTSCPVCRHSPVSWIKIPLPKLSSEKTKDPHKNKQRRRREKKKKKNDVKSSGGADDL